MEEIGLLKRGQCPKFYIYTISNKLTVLFDTGAFFSVWTNTKESLQYHFPDVIDIGCKTIISGFSTEDKKLSKSDLCDVFIIPILYIGNIIIQNLPIAVKNKSSQSADIILSSYVFKNCKFCIDYNTDILTVDYDRSIMCKESRVDLESNIVNKFIVFSQDDYV